MATNLTLPIKMLINVGIDYTPNILRRDLFNRLCIVGSGTNTRGTPYGVYSNLKGVEQHYAADTNEYKIASRLFNQIPRPTSVMIATVEGIVYPAAE